MQGKRGYEGRISPSSAQVVKAPFSTGSKAKGGSVIRGKDLRMGRGEKAGKNQ